MTRRLTYVSLDMTTVCVIVFNDSSFVNNTDLSSQIDFVMCLADGNYTNLIHWSSIKCKKVTRSVLTVELYVMTHDFDIDAVVKITLTKMLNKNISLMLFTKCRSMYDCLMKLRTIIEKRLMINVMTFKQSYERREIFGIRWIKNLKNSADSMTKTYHLRYY
jgi:hypothetical protein